MLRNKKKKKKKKKKRKLKSKRNSFNELENIEGSATSSRRTEAARSRSARIPLDGKSVMLPEEREEEEDYSRQRSKLSEFFRVFEDEDSRMHAHALAHFLLLLLLLSIFAREIHGSMNFRVNCISSSAGEHGGTAKKQDEKGKLGNRSSMESKFARSGSSFFF